MAIVYPSPLTPLQLEALYLQLPVELDGGLARHVSVHFYKNNDPSMTGTKSTAEAKEKAMRPLINKLRDQSKADLGLRHRPQGGAVILRRPGTEIDPTIYGPANQFESVDLGMVQRTFVGKGSPQDIATTLKFCARFGMVGTATSDLQKYCDDYIGLDCSGFVGNYANLALGAGYDLMNKGARSFAPAGKRRAHLADVRPNDVLCWSTTNHVAVIDLFELDWVRLARNKLAEENDTNLAGMRIVVVESNGSRGLNHDTYTVLRVNSDKVFTVRRSYQNTQYKVWIASLP
jgi:hypothetical protein